MCSLTLMLQGRFITVAGSDERGGKADEAEYDGEDGPVSTRSDGVASVVPDIRGGHPWPEWATTAR